MINDARIARWALRERVARTLLAPANQPAAHGSDALMGDGQPHSTDPLRARGRASRPLPAPRPAGYRSTPGRRLRGRHPVRSRALIVELDGWQFHRGYAQFTGDRGRDAVALEAGHVTVRLTAAMLAPGAQAATARRLHAILAERRRAVLALRSQPDTPERQPPPSSMWPAPAACPPPAPRPARMIQVDLDRWTRAGQAERAPTGAAEHGPTGHRRPRRAAHRGSRRPAGPTSPSPAAPRRDRFGPARRCRSPAAPGVAVGQRGQMPVTEVALGRRAGDDRRPGSGQPLHVIVTDVDPVHDARPLAEKAAAAEQRDR